MGTVVPMSKVEAIRQLDLVLLLSGICSCNSTTLYTCMHERGIENPASLKNREAYSCLKITLGLSDTYM